MSELTETRELVFTRHFTAPPEDVWRAWTEPEILCRWFTPAPWSTARAELDVRPGGTSLVVMRDPDGNEHPNPGVYLEVVKHEKLVLTDAYVDAWTPSAHPFMTLTVTFAEEKGGTRYTATVRHWSEEDRKQHEAMGFHDGWAKAAEQLATILPDLRR